MTIDDFEERVNFQVPWRRRSDNWSGKLITLDDTPTTDFKREDIARVFAANMRGEMGGWDGKAAAIIQLKDDRWVAWESFWAPTGSGFSYDAYGGDSNVYFGSTLENVIAYGLTNDGRDILGLDIENWSNPDAILPKIEDITN